MKALTILTKGRLGVFGPVLDFLVSKGVIKSWCGIPIRNRKEMAGCVDDKFRSRVVYLEKRYFGDSVAANTYLHYLPTKYRCFDFGTVLAAEKHVPRHFPNGITDIANMIRGVDDFFAANKPGIIIGDFPASALDMAAYQIAKSRGIPTIFINGFRSGDRLLFCYEPEKGLKEYISYLYYKYNTNGLKESTRRQAEGYLKDFRAKNSKPSCYNLTLFEGRKVSYYVPIRKWVSFASDLVRNQAAVALRVNTSINYLRFKREWEKLFVPLDEKDRIIFFPLHFQPEASTYVRSPYYKDQYAVIQNLCLCIPAGYTLYVKEHARHILKKTPSFLKKYLAEFPNLKFLDLSTDSHEMIKRSKLVVVLAGTAGWEAFLYGVPVLQFGTAFYREFKGVYRFEGYHTLRDQIKKILDKHQPDEEEMIRAIAAVLDGTFPGDLPSRDPSVLEEDKMNRFADTIIRGIEFYPVWKDFLRHS